MNFKNCLNTPRGFSMPYTARTCMMAQKKNARIYGYKDYSTNHSTCQPFLSIFFSHILHICNLFRSSLHHTAQKRPARAQGRENPRPCGASRGSRFFLLRKGGGGHGGRFGGRFGGELRGEDVRRPTVKTSLYYMYMQCEDQGQARGRARRVHGIARGSG